MMLHLDKPVKLVTWSEKCQRGLGLRIYGTAPSKQKKLERIYDIKNAEKQAQICL